MRILILGGAGAMATGTVRDLVTSSLPEMTSLVIAETSLARAEALARETGDARVRAAQIDVADTAALHAALAEADICINAVPTFAGHQMAIFDACLQSRTTYVDYGGMGVFTVEQKKQAEAWRQAGVTAVLGLGADPGISNIICKAVAERLDRIDSINLYWAAARVGEDSPVLVPPYNVATLLAEFGNSSTQFLDGALREVPPQSGKEVLRLPEPWGETEFIFTQHSEPLTVPFAQGIREKGIREFTWKLHLPRAEHEAWSGLVRAGFGDFDEPVSVDGVEVHPVAFLNAIIQRNIARNADRIPAQDSHEIHLAIGQGERDGKPCRVNQAVLVGPHPDYAGYLDPATSMGLSVGVQLLMRNPLKPGVWGPEEYFAVEPFFAELEARHFQVRPDIEVA
jgi:saccharopine dehydrogenase-like NADP-dependent oxidoreductase